MSRVNLLDFDAARMAEYVQSIGEKPFRAQQLMRWIHRRGARNFEAMSDLAKSLRAKLSEQAQHQFAAGAERRCRRRRHAQVAARCRTGQRDRSRFHSGRRSRHAVHLDAGRMRGQLRVLFDRPAGFNRNLTTGEIIGQLWMAEHSARRSEQQSSRRRATPIASISERRADGHGRAAAKLRCGVARAAL